MIWHSHSVDEVLMELNTDRQAGLSVAVACDRLAEYGENKPAEPATIVKRDRFFGIALLVLWIVCAAALLLSLYRCLVDSQPFRWKQPVFTACLSFLLLAFRIAVTRYLSKLRRQAQRVTAPAVSVRRDGLSTEISAHALVPGDIIELSVGDLLAADCRLITADQLLCDERAITGEEQPARKSADTIHDDITPIHQRDNMVYTGCRILRGTAVAVVVATGQQAEPGHNDPAEPATPADKPTGIKRFVKPAALLMGGISLLLGICLQQGIMNSLLLAAALTVTTYPFTEDLCTAILLRKAIPYVAAAGMHCHDLSVIQSIASADALCIDTAASMQETVTPRCAYVNKELFALTAETASKARLPIRLATLCCHAATVETASHPLEKALLTYCAATDCEKKLLLLDMPLLGSLPFPTRTISVHQTDDRAVIIACGDPDDILSHCTKSTDDATDATAVMRQSCNRTVAVAFRFTDDIPTVLDPELLEHSLTLAGLIGFGSTAESTAAISIKDASVVSMPDNEAACDRIERIRALQENDKKVAYFANSADDLPVMEVADIACATHDAPSYIKAAAHAELTKPAAVVLPEVMRITRRATLYTRCVSAALLAALPALAVIALVLVSCGYPPAPTTVLWLALLVHSIGLLGAVSALRIDTEVKKHLRH